MAEPERAIYSLSTRTEEMSAERADQTVNIPRGIWSKTIGWLAGSSQIAIKQDENESSKGGGRSR